MEDMTIRIKKLRTREDQKIFVGSVYKSMSEYMAGGPLTIAVHPKMELNDIADTLRTISEMIASATSIITEENNEDEEDCSNYKADPDDPADNWKI